MKPFEAHEALAAQVPAYVAGRSKRIRDLFGFLLCSACTVAALRFMSV